MRDSISLQWDADGQLLAMQRFDSSGIVRGSRTHLWNENGQLSMFISDDQAGYYGYDGNGERAYKLTGYVSQDGYNGGTETTQIMLNDAVLYVNPYFIVTPKGYTKHYYNGSQRLAAVVGDIQSLPNNMVKDGDNDSSKAYMHSFVSEDTLLNMHVHVEENLLLPILSKRGTGDAGGSPATNYVLKDNTYYYHGDHLGSCSWITAGNGDIIEHRRYLPYGEEWYYKKFNESNYSERFKFTGKERDEESGYDYFGARYYDAMLLTSWLSVDMLSDVDAERTPYNYCKGNPMMLYDPDGNFPHVVVGAAIGAVVGAGFALYEGKSWSEVGAAAAGGAVMGAIIAATGGLAAGAGISIGQAAVITAGGGAIGGAAGSLTEQGINMVTGNQAGIDIGEIKKSAMWGSVFEGAGGVVNKYVEKGAANAIEKIGQYYNDKSVKNAIKLDIKAGLKQQGMPTNKAEVSKFTNQRIKDLRSIDIKGQQNKSDFIQKYGTPAVTNTAENEIK